MYDSELLKYIDVDTALARIRNNKKLYKRMLAMLLDSKEFDSFEEQIAENNYSKASEVAHAIKGMTGNLGLDPLFELSTKLMLLLRENQLDIALLEEYRQTLTATIAHIKNLIVQLDSEIT